MAAVVLTSSCINDDQDDCGLNLTFRYVYNVKSADAFGTEVKSIAVYAFDKDGKFVERYDRSADKLPTGYTMNIRGLRAGKYTFVCLARSVQAADAKKDFAFAELTPGQSTIDDLKEKLPLDANGETNQDFASLYVGKTDVDVENGPCSGRIDLMKCTNRVRVIIMPPKPGDTSFTAENFSMRVDGASAWLNHDGSRNGDVAVTYRPFNQVVDVADGAVTGGEAIDRAVVADFKLSRLFDGSKPTLTINDLRNGNEVFKIDLAWLFTLQGMGIKFDDWAADWSDQEYLDRQDFYTLTVFVNGDWIFEDKVVVNGWVLNLIDTDL